MVGIMYRLTNRRSPEESALSIHIAQTGRHAVLAIRCFVFEMRSEFLEAMRRVISLPDCDDISVDLSATEYLDSSAIGMLLILRDRALDAAGRRGSRVAPAMSATFWRCATSASDPAGLRPAAATDSSAEGIPGELGDQQRDDDEKT